MVRYVLKEFLSESLGCRAVGKVVDVGLFVWFLAVGAGVVVLFEGWTRGKGSVEGHYLFLGGSVKVVEGLDEFMGGF